MHIRKDDIVVVLAGASELAGTVALLIGASRRYDGPMGKSDRAVVFGALAALLAIGLRPGIWLDLVLLAVAACQRLLRPLRSRSPARRGREAGPRTFRWPDCP